MNNRECSREELIAELMLLRQRTARLEKLESDCQRAEQELASYRECLEDLVKERTASLGELNEPCLSG